MPSDDENPQPPPQIGTGLNVRNPEPFSFVPEEWPRYRTSVEWWFTISKAGNQAEPQKRITLLYIMGEKVHDVIATFRSRLTAETTLAEMLDLFDEYFAPKTNFIAERGKFWERRQKEGESNDEFICSIFNMGKSCNYGDQLDEHLRDKLCQGMRDRRLAAELRTNYQLTLDDVVKRLRCKQTISKDLRDERERVKETLKLVKSEMKTETLDAVSHKKGKARKPMKQDKPKTEQSPSTSKDTATKVCFRCAEPYTFAHRQKCTAYKATCGQCGRKGHLTKCCMQQKMKEVTATGLEDEDSDAECYMLASLQTNSTPQWRAGIQVGSQTVDFKADPGADVTAMSLADFQSLNPIPKCKKAKAKLCGPDRTPLDTVNMFYTELKYKQKIIRERVYVVRGLENNLLGRRACVDLELVKWQGEPSKDLLIQQVTQDPEKTLSSRWDPKTKFPECFQGIGTMPVEYRIKLRPDAIPFAISSPRTIPHPIRQLVKQQLEDLEKEGIISEVKEPTEWCAGLVPVPKASDPTKFRLCVDHVQLNKAIIRERIILPTVEDNMAKFAGAQIFSKLDCRDSFWQVKLHPESRLLTTFLTPWKRYAFNRLSMGLCSSTEFFHKAMNDMLSHIPGVVIHVDDIAVFGATMEEHDERLHRVLSTLQANGVTLNSKCLFRVTSMPWVGYIISADGSSPDPEHVKAITDLPPPVDKTGVKSLQAKVQFLRKFVPNMADIIRPITDLLRDNNEFVWQDPQKHAFEELKKILTSQPVLSHYDPNKYHRVASDASLVGLGCTLEQQEDNGDWKPVMYASRRLTETEARYAILEIEALGIVWACTKFHDYIAGKEFVILTDHKPLVTILGAKNLNEMSPRLQRLRLKLMPYSFTMEYVPGKEHHIPDLLSRNPLSPPPSAAEHRLIDEVTSYGNHVVNSLPIKDEKIAEITQAIAQDHVCKKVMTWICSGFPTKKPNVGKELTNLWALRPHLAEHDGLILYNQRIYIPQHPPELRDSILQSFHAGHQGVAAMRARAGITVYWPGLSTQLASVVDNCPICNKTKRQLNEPLMPSVTPDYPWQRVAMDVAEVNTKHYLVIVDCYSRYPEVHLLPNMRSSTMIDKCKDTFARVGVPRELRCDNATPFVSAEFREFLQSWNITLTTSSPKFPQSNGQAESAVKIVKRILQSCKDPYLGLLAYRSTPLGNLQYSPAQLAMGRQLRSPIPVSTRQLLPQTIDPATVKNCDRAHKDKQKLYFDKHHAAHPLPVLKPGDLVWIADLHRYGTITANGDTPRSYLIDTSKGVVRRNRLHLRKVTAMVDGDPLDDDTGDSLGSNIITPVSAPTEPLMHPPSPVPPPREDPPVHSPANQLQEGENPQGIDSTQRQTRAGRTVKPPVRLDL